MNPIVRRAKLDDLDTLVSFTLAEAKEAEGIDLSPQVICEGINCALEDPETARYWVLVDHEVNTIGSVSVVKEWSDWRAGYY
jgi:hypothetical protein